MTAFTPHPSLPADQVFLVGGAVRDHVLGREVRDRDFVVVGLTSEDMISRGFAPVGKDFPVFLDPTNNEEYALARQERKTAPGYHGFSVECVGVTLEEDLARRDLTMNAMAMDSLGRIIDPFGGQADLAAGVLRHVSDAFAEDPVRVLRVARLSARFGFVVHDDTLELMRRMVGNGEVDHLVAERVWMEWSKACSDPTPSRFLSVLRDCGALARVLPEVDALYGVPQNATYHPEIDTGIHTEMVCDVVAAIAPGNVRVAFAALTHDLGKALTPSDEWPKHLGHETGGLEPLEGLIKRWKVPTDAAQLAKAVCAHHLTAHQAQDVRTGTLLRLLESVDGLRNAQRWEEFILACMADKRGRLGMTNDDYPQADLLRAVRVAARGVSGQAFADRGLPVDQIKEEIYRERLRAIKKVQWAHKHRNNPEILNAPPKPRRLAPGL